MFDGPSKALESYKLGVTINRVLDTQRRYMNHMASLGRPVKEIRLSAAIFAQIGNQIDKKTGGKLKAHDMTFCGLPLVRHDD